VSFWSGQSPLHRVGGPDTAPRHKRRLAADSVPAVPRVVGRLATAFTKCRKRAMLVRRNRSEFSDSGGCCRSRLSVPSCTHIVGGRTRNRFVGARLNLRASSTRYGIGSALGILNIIRRVLMLLSASWIEECLPLL